MSYEVRFNYARLQKDLGYLCADIPRLLKGLFDEDVSETAVYSWFNKERLPIERLAQLLTIVRIETGKKLDVWKYIEAKRPSSRAA